jgi:hypothetical protein
LFEVNITGDKGMALHNLSFLGRKILIITFHSIKLFTFYKCDYRLDRSFKDRKAVFQKSGRKLWRRMYWKETINP